MIKNNQKYINYNSDNQNIEVIFNSNELNTKIEEIKNQANITLILNNKINNRLIHYNFKLLLQVEKTVKRLYCLTLYRY